MIRQKLRKKIKGHINAYQAARWTIDIYSKIFGQFYLLPNFLIIGAPRGGTSSLFFYLNHHSSIFPCKIKEPNFFAMYYDRGINWYRTFFPTVLKKRQFEKTNKTKFVTGEASTQYYWHPQVPKRVKETVPNVKLIMLLRNPVDRSYSQYKMEVRHGNEKLSFEEAIAKEKERIEGEYDKMLYNELYFSEKYTMHAYISKSLYFNFIKQWFDYFPKENFLFVKSEDFYQNTKHIMKEIFQFLDVPLIPFNESKILRKGIYENIDSKTRENLKQYFKPYNEKLFSLINQNFEWN